MKPTQHGIEALTIRRASVADADKVRYRVYSTPKEFIAVIAESALMAVKVSGISKPHKIVRDLPTEGIAVEARKMAARDNDALRYSLPTTQMEAKKQLVAELQAVNPIPKQQLHFKAMTIGDLQHKGMTRARIIPPDMVNEIIEQHSKATMPPMPEAEQPAPLAPVDALPPAPEMEPKEKLMQMAQEMTPAAPPEEKVLTPEEVEKLLNG